MTSPSTVALSTVALDTLPPTVAGPGFDRGAARAGIVHLGVGGFHRSHQAVYVQRLLAAGHLEWGIHGVGILPADAALRDALAPQDWLYTLCLRDNDGSTDHEVVGSLVAYTLAPEDPDAVCALLAAVSTAVVTLTITEGGYSVDKASGAFVANDSLRADARPGAIPTTAFGFLVAGLRRRRDTGGRAFTVVSCDNLPHNGDLTRTALVAFARLSDPDLADWIEQNAAFPNSMVDRITPVTTAADRATLRAGTGIVDRWPVVAEPYLQWVLEDRFSDRRPPLAEVGVQLVADVGPYELMKLRLLNASHQVMSYLGVLAGYGYVHEVAADPDFVALLRRWMDAEARPTLPSVRGVDLDGYRDQLLHRFANPAVGDTLARNCAQGSERIATFVLPVVRDALTLGLDISVAALGTAAWARYARGTDERGAAIEVVDDRSVELAPLLRRAGADPAAVLEAADVFGPLGRDDRFRTAFLAADAALSAGTRAAVRGLLTSPVGTGGQGRGRP